jgi:DNA-binding NarL/FixJ family response regulator
VNGTVPQTKVLLVDAEKLTRAGISAAIADELDVRVVAETSSGSEALELAERYLPDVVLMDVRLSDVDGIETMRRMLDRFRGRPLPSVVIFTSQDLDDNIFRSMTAGASGYLLKSASRTMLLRAIRSVAEGQAFMCPQTTRRLIDRFEIIPRSTTAGRPDVFDELSKRELEVLHEVAKGKSNKEIAHDMRITSATIKCHVSSLLAKLGLRDRVQAALLVQQTQLMGYSSARAHL